MSRGTGFFKSSIPGALSTVLENVRPRFSQPDWLPLGLRRYHRNSQHRKESGFFTVGCPVTWTFHPQIYSDIWAFSQVFEVFLQIFDNSNGIFFMMQYQSKSPAMRFLRYSSFWKIFKLPLEVVRPRLQTSWIIMWNPSFLEHFFRAGVENLVHPCEY